MIEPTITYGAIIGAFFNVIVLLFAAGGSYFALKYANRLTQTELQMLAKQMGEMKDDLKHMASVIGTQAVQDEKILAAGQALAAFRGEYNERHKGLRERIDRLEQAVFKPFLQGQQQQKIP